MAPPPKAAWALLCLAGWALLAAGCASATGNGPLASPPCLEDVASEAPGCPHRRKSATLLPSFSETTPTPSMPTTPTTHHNATNHTTLPPTPTTHHNATNHTTLHPTLPPHTPTPHTPGHTSLHTTLRSHSSATTAPPQKHTTSHHHHRRHTTTRRQPQPTTSAHHTTRHHILTTTHKAPPTPSPHHTTTHKAPPTPSPHHTTHKAPPTPSPHHTTTHKAPPTPSPHHTTHKAPPTPSPHHTTTHKAPPTPSPHHTTTRHHILTTTHKPGPTPSPPHHTTTHHHNLTTSHQLGPTTRPHHSSPPPPVPPTLPPFVQEGDYRVKGNASEVCLRAQMGLQLRVHYATNGQAQAWGEFSVQPNRTNATGRCLDKTNALQLDFPEGFVSFFFTKNETQNTYFLSQVQAKLTYQFPHAAESSFAAVNASLREFQAHLGHSYQCRNRSLVLKEGFQLSVLRERIQAFGLPKGEFGEAEVCPQQRRSSVLPIVVGVVLGLLILTVVVAFLVGRWRRRPGYQTL